MTVDQFNQDPAMSSNLPSIRDLYLADSIKKLDEIVDSKTKLSKDKTYETYKRLIRTALNEANQYLKNGDQEHAYVFFQVVSTLIVNGSKSKQGTDPKYFKSLYSSDFKRSLDHLTILKNQLEVRYKRKELMSAPVRPLKADSRSTTPTSQNSSTNELNADSPESTRNDALKIKNGMDQLLNKASSVNNNNLSATKTTDEVDATGIKIIKPSELFSLFNSESGNIIILQLRHKDDYNKHRMDKLPKNVDVVKIDPELIRQYPSKSHLMSKLDVSSRCSLSGLQSAKYVILMDDSSEEISLNSPLELLYNIFFKLVRESEKISGKALILYGGFNEWAITYPTYTTKLPLEKPTSLLPSFPIATSPSQDSPLATNHAPPPLTNGTATDPSNDELIKEKVPSSISQYNWNRSNPGGAKKINDANEQPIVPKPSIPDRSTKPTLVTSTATPVLNGNIGNGDDVGNTINRETKPKLVPNDRVEELSGDLKKLDLNNSSARNVPARGSCSIDLPTPPFIANGKEPINNYISNNGPGVPRIPTDRTVSESRSDFPSLFSSGGLSRSYSSPNINEQINEEQQQVSQRKLPSIDRSVKPSVTLNDRRPSTLGPVDISLLSGLKNLGNTCYMNSIIQCLAACPDLVLYFLSGQYNDHLLLDGKFGTGGTLARQMAHLFRQMSARSYSYISPNEFRKIVNSQMPSFTLGEQHDSHEFFTMLIDKLHADLNQAAKDVNYTKLLNNKKNSSSESNNPHERPQTHIALKKFYEEHISLNRSIFTELFEGILLSTLECSVCSSKSDTFEIFTCLSLPIPTNCEPRTTLGECWNTFVADEHLTGDAAWDCTVCKVKRDAVKKIKICRLPKILVIHLKR